MNIKVFAHHEKDLRWRTLIQVDGDWTIRGTVFMKNPGSSAPTAEELSIQELSNLNEIDNSSDWYNFTLDPTMRAIVNLFCKRAEFYGEQFKGTIQIFNIINIMGTDPFIVLADYMSEENPLKSTVDADIRNIVPPVYIGWGGFYRNPQTCDIASQILQAVQNVENIQYQLNAGFIHPLYLMVYGSSKQKCIQVKENFFWQ